MQPLSWTGVDASEANLKIYREVRHLPKLEAISLEMFCLRESARASESVALPFPGGVGSG